jgi:Lon protease-like protein
MTYELPLFPLNTVLFPGMPLALHIFEERYKQMIRVCLARQIPFGVVLIREGQEALGPPAEPYEIGCTAEIAHRQRLPGDRLHILALGKERFRIRATSRERPYLVSTVEPFPLRRNGESELAVPGRQLRGLVERYFTLLGEAELAEFDQSQLPDDPAALAYVGAGVLQAPNEQKQALLGCETASELLTAVIRQYRTEIPLLRYILENGPQRLEAGDQGFSLN